tara:strand:+ start:1110 stop:1952 length:843 start_codon:yes stop_codon:yes gene_type:complete
MSDSGCDCSDAVDKVKNELRDRMREYSIANNEDLFKDLFKDSGVPDNFMKDFQNNYGTSSAWIEIQPGTEIEGKEGKENFQNNETINFIYTGIEERHDRFKEYSNFPRECNKNAGNAISKLLRKDKEDLDKLYNYYNAYLDDYKTLNTYKDSTISIISNKLNELESLKDKINSYNKNMIIDNRKSNYQKNNYDFYQNIHFYILILYYALFVVYLIFSKFIKEKQYYNKKIIFVMLIYLILPFILKYLLNFINSIYNYILESNNLKKDTLTYQDMINNKTN